LDKVAKKLSFWAVMIAAAFSTAMLTGLYCWWGRKGIVTGGLVLLVLALVLLLSLRRWRKVHRRTIKQLFQIYIGSGNLTVLDSIVQMPLCDRDLARVRRWRKDCLKSYSISRRPLDLEKIHRADEVVQRIKEKLESRI